MNNFVGLVSGEGKEELAFNKDLVHPIDENALNTSKVLFAPENNANLIKTNRSVIPQEKSPDFHLAPVPPAVKGNR